MHHILILVLTLTWLLLAAGSASAADFDCSKPAALTKPQADACALYREGVEHRDGAAGQVDLEKAFAKFLAAAELGHGTAQYQTGLAYEYGFGVKPNPGEARSWYFMGMNNNHAFATDRFEALNNLLMRKKSEKIDPKIRREISQRAPDMLDEAFAWVRGWEGSRFAKEGANTGAKRAEQDRGVRRGAAMIRSAAGHPHNPLTPNPNYAKATFLLATMYRHGYGVEKSMNEAVAWYEKASAQHYPPASMEMALYYFGKKDFKRAESYLRDVQLYGDSASPFLRSEAQELQKRIIEMQPDARKAQPEKVQSGVEDTPQTCRELDATDPEAADWCYIGLAKKQKSLSYCNYFARWQSISFCIDNVAKVTTLTPAHCDQLNNSKDQDYRDLCRKKIGR